MKILIAVLLFLVAAATAFAQPDPRDSVILESKTVAPGAHPYSYDTSSYLYIRVWITNKDSLKELNLALVQKSISGGAWVVTGRPGYFGGVVSRLTNTLGNTGECFSGNCYPSDSLRITGSYNGNPAAIEPPNVVRKPFWEIKLDSVLNGPGITELDTGIVLSSVTGFVNRAYQRQPVNFVKSVITVVPKGDLNLDGQLSVADVMLMLNYIFEMAPTSPVVFPCDLNCDRWRSPADLVVLINAVFSGEPFPC